MINELEHAQSAKPSGICQYLSIEINFFDVFCSRIVEVLETIVKCPSLTLYNSFNSSKVRK